MMKLEERDWSMDFLRIFACMMVVIVHTAAQSFYILSPKSYEWTVINIYDTFGRPSIALFFMISGYLFLRKKTIDYKKLWINNILHILIVYIVWVVLYAVVFPGFKSSLKNFQEIKDNINGTYPFYHLWYLRALLNIYAITPILWALVRAMDKKLLRYFLLIFFVFGIIRNTIYDFTEYNSWLHHQFDLFSGMDLVGYTAYFILGYAFSDESFTSSISDRTLTITYFITLILAAFLNQMISIIKNVPDEAFYGHFSLPVMIEAVCLFLLARRRLSGVQLSPKTGVWVKRISESTFFVYLVHLLVIHRLQIYFNLHTTRFNVLYWIPILSLIVFIISSVLGMIIKKIPVINKILL